MSTAHSHRLRGVRAASASAAKQPYKRAAAVRRWGDGEDGDCCPQFASLSLSPIVVGRLVVVVVVVMLLLIDPGLIIGVDAKNLAHLLNALALHLFGDHLGGVGLQILDVQKVGRSQ